MSALRGTRKRHTIAYSDPACRATFISCFHCGNPNDCVTFYVFHFAIFNAWARPVLTDLVFIYLFISVVLVDS